jgi:hypothetical protein
VRIVGLGYLKIEKETQPKMGGLKAHFLIILLKGVIMLILGNLNTLSIHTSSKLFLSHGRKLSLRQSIQALQGSSITCCRKLQVEANQRKWQSFTASANSKSIAPQ